MTLKHVEIPTFWGGVLNEGIDGTCRPIGIGMKSQQQPTQACAEASAIPYNASYMCVITLHPSDALFEDPHLLGLIASTILTRFQRVLT